MSASNLLSEESMTKVPGPPAIRAKDGKIYLLGHPLRGPDRAEYIVDTAGDYSLQ
jgi:hypothetical protein